MSSISYQRIGAGGSSYLSLSGQLSGPTYALDGIATAPSYTFLNSAGTGMWSPAANQLAFSQNGIQALLFSGSQAATFGGNVILPSASVVAWGAASAAGGSVRWASGTFFFERGDGSSASGSGTFSGTLSAGNMITGNTGNNSNVGLAAGSGASGIRIDYTGTAALYRLRNGSGTEGTGCIIQGQFVAPKASNYTVVAADSGTLFYNTAAVQFTLPVSVAGYRYRFVNAGTATQLTIKASGAEVIALDGGTTTPTTGLITSVRANSYVELQCLVAGTWVQTSNTKAATDFTVT